MSGGQFQGDNLLLLLNQIVCAHLANPNTTLASSEVAAFIKDIHQTLCKLPCKIEIIDEHSTGPVELLPAVPIEESICPEHIVCLEDGKKFKTLRRHLMARYNLTPEEYQKKWGLPENYPMVSPSYSRKRSKISRELSNKRSKK